MAHPATSGSPSDHELLDQLVPPVHRTLRGGVAWLVFVGLIAAITWAWATGTATPSIAWSHTESYGGSNPVHIGLALRNESRVDIEIVDGPRPRDGLRLLGFTTGQVDVAVPDLLAIEMNPFPLRLAPRESASLQIWYEVVDCEAIRADEEGDIAVDLQARIADGPFSFMTRTRSVQADLGAVMTDRAHPSWPEVIAQHAC